MKNESLVSSASVLILLQHKLVDISHTVWSWIF